jgi:hypothetical protein
MFKQTLRLARYTLVLFATVGFGGGWSGTPN